jgi:Glycerophosphoryl diester phosphodiesterase family
MSRLGSRLLRYILPSIVLIHSLLFMAYWLTNSLFYTETNDYLAKLVGNRLDYISLLLVISALIGLWSIARLVTYKLGFKHRLASLTTGLYVVIGLVFIAFFYGSFWLLFSKSPVQLPRIIQMVSYFRLLIDILVLLVVALLLGTWVRGKILQQKTGDRVSFVPVLACGLALLVLWALAAIFPPGSVYRAALPLKPLLIAHRGASMLAPENTPASATLAADLGVYGLETDIHISKDGKPFLMHDDTLVRTTTVNEVYPDRSKNRAEDFTLAELTRLNTGKWFVDRDPYNTISSGQVSDSQIEAYLQQTVPTLTDELQIAREQNLVFAFFDLYPPPGDHPYAGTFFDICLSEIQAAGIDAQVWFPVNEDQLILLKSKAPAMKPVFRVDYQSPPTTDQLSELGYQIVNAEYGLPNNWIRQYQAANIWVNLFTIDEPWQYSRLWLMGVDSTTSSNVHTLLALHQPVFSLPYKQYFLVWSAVGILSLGLYLLITLPAYRPSQR